MSAGRPRGRYKVTFEGTVDGDGRFAAEHSDCVWRLPADWRNYATVIELIPPPAPEWSELVGAVCRFTNHSGETWVRTAEGWSHALCDLTNYRPHRGVSFEAMCDEYPSEPVCLFDPGAAS